MGKRYDALLSKVEKGKNYEIDEALNLIKELANAKFDESVEVHIKLNIDPKKTDQTIRTSVLLPNGIGKTKKVLAFVKGEKVQEAQDAGADYIGDQETVEKILKGWMDFDSVIATPDMMPVISKLGKVLGPRGLMPNAKTGTVTMDVERAIKEIKMGKIEIKTDKLGNIHSVIGKVSFDEDKLKENFLALIDAIMKAKPSSVKGQFIKSIYIATTMGPALKLDVVKVLNSLT
ncbi:MAG TPA: 50S ribosomal protein L1 [Caldisericia bacterium]|nr:50S ribosomal protein L1 [Caldisericia bacterium]HQL67164.1 50S ribosomal protein L1 [Caldisericia bacterium]